MASKALDPAPFREIDDPQENRSWTATLAEATRAAIRDLHRINPAYNATAIAFVAAWAAAAALVLVSPAWPLRLSGYAAMGIAIHALAILMHEGSHGNLCRRKVRDRWIAFACGVPVLLAASAYRVVHMEHHRYVRTQRDPEEFTNLSPYRWVQSLAFYVWFAIGTLTYLLYVPIVGLMRGTPRDRRDIVSEYLLLGNLYGCLVALAIRFELERVLLHCLVFPWIVTLALSNVRGWAEHPMTLTGHPLTQTRTVTSNRVVSLLMCNTNYHLEHHLYPGVPWYNLRRLHDLLRDDYRAAGSFVQGSYFQFLWQAIRTGVHGVVGAGSRPDPR